MTDLHPSSTQWIELDAAAIAHNIGLFRSVLAQNTQLLAVVKANAYGHGLEAFAEVAADWVDWFGVHTAGEAKALRRAGIGKPILVMGVVPPGEFEGLDDGVHLLAASVSALEWIGDYRQRSGIRLPVHLKVDTGAKRQGFALSRLDDVLEQALRQGHEVVGLATHFANIEDTLEHEFARTQLDRFRRALDLAENRLGGPPRWVHAACSAASLLFRETDFSLARVGISIYGHWPSRETRLSWILEHGRSEFDLQPTLSWRAIVGQLQRVAKGETVGYGRSWTALRDTTLAVIPVGYADGYSRALGNRARVLIHGREAPVVGRVCMNIFMIDVTDISGVEIGDVVTLIGTDGEVAIPVEDLAGHSDTINYEFLARLSPSIPRLVRT
ncbi:MAG: alanine racemase [Candidatus Sulfomarinibacteraceae bacterium]